MPLDVIDPYNDARVERRSAVLNGTNYGYIYGEPKDGKIRGTVFLVHGWPDLSIAWRYQIPMLLQSGLRVVAPDMMGYGQTDAPKVPPASLSKYSMKTASDDLAELARQIGLSRIIIGGHDWGGAVVWRFAQFHPQLVSHVFSVCTPYQAPRSTYDDLDAVVKKAPQFGYQKHLASPEVEGRIQTKKELRTFLNGLFGGLGSNKEFALHPMKGVLFDNLPKLQKTRLVSDKELDYYAEQYARNGLHGPVNWYRTREINWKDDQQLKSSKVEQPSLMIIAEKDNVLLPALSEGMDKYIPRLTKRTVNASHWALWQAAEHTNQHIKEWLEGVVFGGKSKL